MAKKPTTAKKFTRKIRPTTAKKVARKIDPAKTSAKPEAKPAAKPPAKARPSAKTPKPASKTRLKRPQSAVIRQGDKAAFVRGQPRSKPASVIVDEAKEKGMIISKAYIHNIRSAANKKSRDIMKKAGNLKLKGSREQREAQLRALIVDLGPARSHKILTQVETALAREATAK